MTKQPEWKSRFQEIVQTCQNEIKRTTEIGKKMLSASKTNTCLHEAYEELGHLVFKALENDELKWEDKRVGELIETVKNCESDLEDIEQEVNNIKFSPGPESVNENETDFTSKR